MSRNSDDYDLNIDYKKLIIYLNQKQLIPIIGNTIRNQHIFDINFDDRKGITPAYLQDWSATTKISNGELVKDCTAAEVVQAIETGRDHARSRDQMHKSNDKVPSFLEDLESFWDEWRNAQLGLTNSNMDDAFKAYRCGWFEIMRQIYDNKSSSYSPSISEELAQAWANMVNYPLKNGNRISRVAQFVSPKPNIESRDDSKLMFLEFQKSYLLEVAATLPEMYDDVEEAALVLHLMQDIEDKSFGDIVDELDFPRFPDGWEDPIRILAQMPIPFYFTTGYYDFIERELISVGKTPRSVIFPWHTGLKSEKYKKNRFEINDIATVDNPIVYHLFGMEEIFDSLVLSEDDYLDFLWALANEKDNNEINTPYLLGHFANSKLLLLGYRLHDWDFRVLLRGFLRDGFVKYKSDSVALHVDLGHQQMIQEWGEEKAEKYLKDYFGGVNFDVEWKTPSDEFIIKLYETYWEKYHG